MNAVRCIEDVIDSLMEDCELVERWFGDYEITGLNGIELHQAFMRDSRTDKPLALCKKYADALLMDECTDIDDFFSRNGIDDKRDQSDLSFIVRNMGYSTNANESLREYAAKALA